MSRGIASPVPVAGSPGRLRWPEQLAPGWYLLRITCALPKRSGRATVWVIPSGSEAPTPSARMPLRDGRPAMRLLHVPQDSMLEFQPGVPDAAIRRFRLWRVPLAVGRYLVQRRLRLRHPGYADQSHAQLLRRPFDALWQDYNRLFDEPGSARLRHDEWIARHELSTRIAPAAQATALRSWPRALRVLCLLPSDPDAERDAYARAVTQQSLSRQGYPHWDMLALPSDATPRAANLSTTLLDGYDAVTLLRPGDQLRDDALYLAADALRNEPSVHVVYSDHDRIDGGGLRRDPCFKPGFSRDLLYARNLIAPFALMRAEALRAAGGPGAAWTYGAASAHALTYVAILHLLERLPDAAVRRLPHILCHIPVEPVSGTPPELDDAVALAAVAAHLRPRGAEVQALAPGLRRVRWPRPAPPPLVSLIVPTRNGLNVLRTCVESIEQRTRYRPYELIVVDNQSDDPATLDYLGRLAAEGRARVLVHDAPFNYSAINNAAVCAARGDIIGLINNDIEVISPDWLDEMVGHAVRPDIGCVGAKLYFPDDTIQHAGVVLGVGGVAGHAHKYLPRHAAGYLDLLRLVHNVSAVTGAALVMRKSVFEEVGGLDEAQLQIAYNDVDLCLRVMQAGYCNLWTPHAELYHHESKTRGAEDTPQKLARWRAEREVMKTRWPAWIADDPFYSPHLSRTREDLSVDALPS